MENNIFNLMKDKYSLTIENEKVLIQVEDWGFTTYPITDMDRVIKVTKDEYLGLMLGEYRINLETLAVEENLEIPEGE